MSSANVAASRARSSPLRRLASIGRPVLLVLMYIMVWYGATLLIGPLRVPAPWTVLYKSLTMLVSIPQLRSIPNAGYNLLPHLTSTVVRYVIGVAIGAPLGIVVGLSMGWSRTVNDLVRAPLELVRVTPPLVALPFCLLWFGSGEMSKVFLIASYCFLILVINTFTVIQNVPLVYSRFARTLGATPAHVYLTVILPASVPGIIGGVRVVMAFAWGLEIVGELMGGQFGLGRLAMIFMSYFSPESLMAVMVWIILVGICIDRLVYAVLRHVTRWMPEASHIG